MWHPINGSHRGVRSIERIQHGTHPPTHTPELGRNEEIFTLADTLADAFVDSFPNLRLRAESHQVAGFELLGTTAT
jgi:hypothetical protein